MSAQEDAIMKSLYEASVRGSVSILNTLIQQNPLILNKLSLTTFTETPLHVSALLGHLDFTKTILSHKPKLAKELDSCRRTPLHLASAEGHKEIVHVLLQAYDDACLVHDQDGRIPVHYAAIRGRTEVVRELIKAKPDSLRVLDKGNTLVHLCVTYNHLETLKVVVEEEGETSELLNFGDFDGRNTILHLAAMLKQVETIKYLLSIPKIIEAANNENNMGFTALDIIEHTPKDFKSLEIQLMLTDTGTKSKKKIQNNNPNPLPPPSTTINAVPEVRSSPKKNCWIKFRDWVENLFQEKTDWIEKRRETLGLVTTVISTMSFQVAINPPGGVYQDINQKWKEQRSLCIKYETEGGNETMICPGQALLGIQIPSHYHWFLLYNTISFVVSLSVTIFLVTGIPTKNKVIMWILIIGMVITIGSLLSAYHLGIWMTTPDSIWNEGGILYTNICRVFTAVFWLLGLLLTIRFIAWLVDKCKNGIKRRMSRRTRNSEISIITST